MSVQQGESMREVWASWQGHVLNGTFPLHRWLGSSDHSGVFLTELTLRKSAQVALKVVPAIATFAEAQLAQWSAAALLDHPHLIRILETGQCQFDGAPYLYVVMEYADQTLAELLPRRPLTAPEAREMLVPTLEALAFLHNRNLVLGQLKPANILAVGDQLKLASDTICGVTGGNAGHAGSVYDPPEARDGSCSTASDVWALGVTLFEALAQRPPSLDERRAGVGFPPDFPPAFRSLVTWCLSRRPYDRPKVAEIEAWVRREGGGGQAGVDVASPVADLEVQGAAVVAPAVAHAIEVEDVAAAEVAGDGDALEARGDDLRAGGGHASRAGDGLGAGGGHASIGGDGLGAGGAHASAAGDGLGGRGEHASTGADGLGALGEHASIAGDALTVYHAPVPDGEGLQFELAPPEAPATIETAFFELDEAVVPDPDAFEPVEARAREGGRAPAGGLAQGLASPAHSAGELGGSQVPGSRASSHSSPGVAQAAASRAQSASEHGDARAPARAGSHAPLVGSQGSAIRTHSATEHYQAQTRPPRGSHPSTPVVSQVSGSRAESAMENIQSRASGKRVPHAPRPEMSQPLAPGEHSGAEHADSYASGSRAAGAGARIGSDASASSVPQRAQSNGPQAHGLRAAQTPASAQRAHSATEATGSHAALRPHPTTAVNTPTHVTPQQSPPQTPRTRAEVVPPTPPPGAAAPGAVSSEAVQKAQLARSGVEFVSQRLVYTVAGQELSVPHPRNGPLIPLALIAVVLLAISWMGVRAIILHRDPPVVPGVLPADPEVPTSGSGLRESGPADEQGASEPAVGAAPTTASPVRAVTPNAPSARAGTVFASSSSGPAAGAEAIPVYESAAPSAGAVSDLRSGGLRAAAVSGMGLAGSTAAATAGTPSAGSTVAAISRSPPADPSATAVSGTRAAADGLVAVSTSGARAVGTIAPTASAAALAPSGGFRTAGARAGALAGGASAPSLPNNQPAGAEPNAAAGSSSAVHEEIPDVPQRARRSIHGHVRVSVRVIVDKDGSVFAALVDEPGPSPYFARIALEAAKQWTFPPAATLQGQPTPDRRWEMVRFDFTREGTTGQAMPVE